VSINSKSRKRWLGATFLLLALAGLLRFFGNEANTVTPTTADTPPLEPQLRATPVSTEPMPAKTPLPQAPTIAAASELDLAADPSRIPNRASSLRGTAADGEVAINPDGSVRLTGELRRLFDYYLSRAGEMTASELQRWIDAEFERNYPVPVAIQLKTLLAHYQNYLRALARETPRLRLLKEGDRLAEMTILRRHMLGATMADAFFGNEQAWDQFTLARRTLASDVAISAAERAQREQELVQQLPPDLAQAYRDQRTLDARLTQQLPVDEQARFAAREQLFGTEAAARFADLDQSRAEFERRVRAYLAARTQLPASDALARDRLRAQFFNTNEAARVSALEAIGQEAALFAAPTVP
jgi:lipase chaperone LimK